MNRVLVKGVRTGITLILAGGVWAQGAVFGQEIIINMAPPAPIHETVPASPGPEWVWNPGYHEWVNGRYVWVKGQYIKKPRPAARWVPGHYKQRAKGWVWVPGHWA